MRRLRSPFALALILGVAGLAAAIVAFVFADALADLRSPVHPLRPPASASPGLGLVGADYGGVAHAAVGTLTT
ncbi:MAG: hypothetical protein ABR541_00255 [Candidatus Dormibacteria bacterium]